MGTLREDIKTQADWIVKAFKSDGYNLDFTIKSFIEIDRFFQNNSANGKATQSGRLKQNLGPILFSIGSYIGETFIKNIPGSEWITDDEDPQGEINASIKFPDGTEVFPMQRPIQRFKNGFEDSIYPYGFELTKDHIDELFDQKFWDLGKKQEKKRWWKF